MPEQPNDSRSSWYAQEPGAEPRPAWYDAGDAPFLPVSRGGETAGKARRRPSSAGKVVILTLCVLILIAASAYVFSGSGGRDAALPSRPDSAAGSGGRGTFDDYDDFTDFFENYYVTAESFAPINIPPWRQTDGVSLELADVPGDGELSLQEIYERCYPTVAGITTQRYGRDFSWGSGIVFTDDGYILTNAHVLEGADSAVVKLWDDREFTARLVGYDADGDLAVLKISAQGLAYAQFGDSSALRVGDSVVAIGNPLGEEFRGTMTDGIVSAINRDVTYSGRSMTLLQTNAAINEGNSGGPLFNRWGQVVGVTNMKMMSSYTSIEGIGFAIPSANLLSAVNQLLSQGYISGRPALGITAGSIPADAAEHYSLPDGVYVSVVNPASDAWKKGLQVGDVITAVNDVPVHSVSEINDIKEGCAVGDTLVLTVYRAGETFVVDVDLVDSNSLD